MGKQKGKKACDGTREKTAGVDIGVSVWVIWCGKGICEVQHMWEEVRHFSCGWIRLDDWPDWWLMDGEKQNKNKNPLGLDNGLDKATNPILSDFFEAAPRP